MPTLVSRARVPEPHFSLPSWEEMVSPRTRPGGAGVSLISAPEERSCPPVETASHKQVQAEELQRPSSSTLSVSGFDDPDPFRHISDSDSKLVSRTDPSVSQQIG